MKQSPLQVRIDRLAFECEHDEDAFEELAANESLPVFESQRELTQRG